MYLECLTPLHIALMVKQRKVEDSKRSRRVMALAVYVLPLVWFGGSPLPRSAAARLERGARPAARMGPAMVAAPAADPRL